MPQLLSSRATSKADAAKSINQSIYIFLNVVFRKDLLYSTGNSVQCDVAAWMGGGFAGRMDTCICTAESLHCPLETTTTLLIGSTPIQNHKLKKNCFPSNEHIVEDITVPCLTGYS